MMKKFKQFIAFVLALCMLFSLSVAAFAAEPETHTVYDSAPDEDVAASTETAPSGTIPDSKIKWELNEHNWLMISGSGDCEPFTSKDDQPWANVPACTSTRATLIAPVLPVLVMAALLAQTT